MVKQIIDVGITGNDATGDAIRDAFSKTNNNFNELYAALGNTGGLAFTGLVGAPKTLIKDNILITNSTGTTLLQKKLVAGAGLEIDNTDPNKITIINSGASLVSDTAPALGGHLDARGNIIYNLPDPSNYDTIQSILGLPNQDNFAVSKKYASQHFVPITGSALIGTADLVIGQFYAIADLGTTTNTQWNTIAGTTGHTYIVGSNFVCRVNGPGLGSGTAYVSMSGFLSVPPGGTVTNVPQRQEVVGRSGDTMTGPLILSSNPTLSSHPFTAATKQYVDTTSYASKVNFFVSLDGDDYLPELDEIKKGRALSYAFRSVSRACAAAEKLQKAAESTLGPYQKQIVYTVNGVANASTVYQITQVGTTQIFSLQITHGGNGTDPRAGINYDIRSGLLLQGTGSGAVAIIDYVGSISSTPAVETYSIQYLNDKTFIPGENLYYGEPVKKTQITIHIETGEYYEHYPIRVPENVSLVGDELRRVIIRPKQGPSASKWADTYFRRDVIFDQASPLYLLTAISCGNFIIGMPYVIADLGSTTNDQWNTIAGTSGKFYIVGSNFVAQNSGSGLGTGTAYGIYGHHYLTDPGNVLYSKTINNTGNYSNAQKILYANRAFIQAETIGWINNHYRTIITATTAANNSFTCLSNTNLNIGMPIRFSQPVTYATATNGMTDVITVKSTSGFAPGSSVVFSGNSIGGITLGTTYYVLAVVSSTKFTICTAYPGTTYAITTDSGFMTVTLTGSVMGGVNADTTYYIKNLIGATQFTVSTSINGTTPGSVFGVTDSSAGAVMQGDYYYNQDTRFGDFGRIEDAIGFDLIYGDYYKSLEQSISYYENADSLNLINNELSQTNAALGYLNSIILTVLSQTNLSVSYQYTADPIGQITGLDTAESGYDTVINSLIQLVSDVINQDESFNFPKNNDQMDVYLMNNASICRMFTCQGHGGFMTVLDPVGQIQTKSPFVEICASFCKSINKQTFAGGIFVDGFAANLFCQITNILDTQTLQVYSSSFAYRLPQTPCSFYVNGIRFEIDYTSNFDNDNNILTLHLNNNTTDVNSYTGYADGTILVANSYIELIGAGNRSLVTTHFTNINDLGYSLVATNNGLIEAVSVFTYYNFRALYALNGSQIRSLNGSNAYGVYGITAEGSDPSEIPSSANIYYPMTQTATIFKQSPYASAGAIGDLTIYITNYSYLPTNISMLEIDNAGIITEYQINSVALTATPGVAQVILTSNSGSGVTLSSASSGLVYAVTDGQPVIIRSLQNFRFNNILNIDPIRPSTALQFVGDTEVYRILNYNVQSLPSQEAILSTATSYNYSKLSCDTTAGTAPGTGQTGDYQIAIQNTLSDAEIGALIGKTLAWGTSVHKIVGYENNTVLGTNYSRITLDIPLTKSTLNTLGTISIQSWSRNSSGVVTVTASNHGLSSLNYVNISGTNVTGIDTLGVLVAVTYISSSQFSYQSSTLSATSGTGGTISGIAGNITLRAGINNFKTYKITTVSRSSNIALITTSEPHGLFSGAQVTIERVSINGNSDPGFNATNVSITYVTDYQFSYSNSGATLVSTTAQTGAVFQTTNYSISNFTRSNNITTVTTSSNHQLSQGSTVSIVNTDFNLQIIGTNGSDNSITITKSSSEDGNSYSSSDTTTGLLVGMPIVFSGGNLYGTNISTGTTYYIKSIISTTKISISATPPSGSFSTLVLATIPTASGIATAGYGFGILNVSVVSIPTPTTFTFVNQGTNYDISTLSLAKLLIVNPIVAKITLYISLTRCTGHDFLSIGTGSFADTNYPNNIYGPPNNKPQTANEVIEIGKGRCFYISTDQSGNFKVGPYFSVDQGTGQVKFASSIVLTNLDGLGFKRGVAISAFSADDTMLNDAVDEAPTQSAVVGYINRRLGVLDNGNILTSGQIGPGFMALNGITPMAGTMDMASHNIINLASPVSNSDAATKGFVVSSISSLFPSAGGTLSGNLNMGGNNITNVGNLDMASHTITSVATPVSSTDAANKAYVDNSTSSINAMGKLVDTSFNNIISYTIISAASATGTGPYSVVFTIPTQTIAPTIGIGYTISGNSNSAYNGNFASSASTVSSITINFSSNPGAFGTGTTVLSTFGIAAGDSVIWNGNYFTNASQSGMVLNTLTYNAISQISRSSNTVTIVTSSAHGLNTGDKITINKASITNNNNPGFNGTYSITKVDNVTFTIANAGADLTTVVAITGSALSTSSGSNLIQLSTVNNISVNGPIVFNGSTIGNLQAGQQYYVKSITSQTAISIAEISKTGYVVTVATGTQPFTLLAYTSKVAVGDGTFRITYGISVNPAPTVGQTYLVLGNSNANYNGSYICYAATISSITLTYASDPGTYGSGVTTAQYLALHGLVTGQVVNISGTSVVDQTNAVVTVVNGTTFTFTQSTSSTIAATVITNGLVTPQPQITISSSIGSAVLTQTSATGTMSFMANINGYVQIFNATISAGVITNSMISSTANIDQSKLNLSVATAGSNTPQSPVTFGIAAFNSANFTASNGFISLASNSISLSNIVAINSGNVLGNISGSTGNVNTVPVTSTATNNTLVLRDGSGNFSAGTVTASLIGNVTGNVIGGSSSSSSLTLQSTSGAGSSDTIIFKVGNNGNIVAATISNFNNSISLKSNYILGWDNGSGTSDVMLIRAGSAILQFGAADAASPVAQTIGVQNVVAGTLNTAGAAFTIRGSAGTGTGTGGSLIFQVSPAGTTGGGQNAFATALTIDSSKTATFTGNVLPSSNNSLNLGSSTYNWGTVYGNATSANYADLAENYEGDQEYEVGTVIMIGGTKEVTIANGYMTTKVVGVISENPAHIMNANCPGIQIPVALQGKVPCKVVGKIKRGDLLVVGLVPGVAMADNDPKAGSIIGKALNDYDSDRIGLIEVLVGKH
jgi:hypothetical protein